jgi:hypothetical protein
LEPNVAARRSASDCAFRIAIVAATGRSLYEFDADSGDGRLLGEAPNGAIEVLHLAGNRFYIGGSFEDAPAFRVTASPRSM